MSCAFITGSTRARSQRNSLKGRWSQTFQRLATEESWRVGWEPPGHGWVLSIVAWFHQQSGRILVMRAGWAEWSAIVPSDRATDGASHGEIHSEETSGVIRPLRGFCADPRLGTCANHEGGGPVAGRWKLGRD